MIKTICFIVISSFGIPLLAQKAALQTDLNNKYDSAIKENFKSLEFNWGLPVPIHGIMKSGLNSLAKGEWNHALSSFEKIIEFDSTFVPAFYYRVCCYELGNRFPNEKAYERLKSVIKMLPKSGKDVYLDLWDIYVPQKKHSRMNNPLLEIAPPLLCLSNYLVEHQGEVNAESFGYLKKSLSSLIAARPGDALSLANKALKVESSTCALYLKAQTFQFISQHDSAFYLYNEILKKDEHVIEALANLALYKHQLNDKIGALKHLSSLNKFEPESPRVWRFSGILKSQLQDYYGAILDLTKYIKTDSTDFECMKQRALAQYEVKNYNGSLKDLNSALRLSDSDLQIFLYQSENYLQIGDSIKCIKVLRDAEKIFSFDQRLNLFTANKLVEVNKTRQAQDLIDRVIRVVLRNSFDDQYLHEANIIQCKIYLKNGKPEKAMQKLNLLINKEGEKYDYLLLRAKVYIMKGEKAQAKSELEKLIKVGFKPAVDLYKSL